MPYSDPCILYGFLFGIPRISLSKHKNDVSWENYENFLFVSTALNPGAGYMVDISGRTFWILTWARICNVAAERSYLLVDMVV